ncbi:MULTISPECIES: AAA-like domain-containing protein [Calothrix]|uniref:non-specific serine/threonine protein kinase n=4 Tax=Calothrix TaxID=1186 RepID=A0ABR8A2S1_9CYAN|nr:MULTISPECIES: AAA-like domain-containing protein [Calothrix]MBD2194247.1 AAA-like domain-containing protein [Calothrix parietina FACHB-288]MBD2225043.1 AAA-like domain-containing protein [Calothrix anomala FACHB-343]
MSLIGITLRNRYQIFKQLGVGGFGETYLAYDLDLPDYPTCVVKHLKPKNANPTILEIAQKKFDQEAKILYKLGNAHPQIPQLFAHFLENEKFYLVQEYVDGNNLTSEIIPGYRQSEAEVLKLTKEILEVLAFVHQQGIIHRDIKPMNLMRRKDGKIVLIDFGAVKEIGALQVNPQGESSLTVAIGTPGYMPSEQQALYPQFSSDIYAVGIIAFQALTGLQPLQLPRNVNGEICCALFQGTVNISLGFAEFLDKMVRYDYRQRYQDATAALQALQQQFNISQAQTLVPAPPTARLISSQSGGEASIFQKIRLFFQDLFSESTPDNSFASTVAITQPAFNSAAKQIHFEQPEGQVSLESAFYIERPPIESDCYEEILQSGALIRIKAPRQMGKTSLLTRILDCGTKQGYSAAYLNFQSADAEFFTNLDKFLQWFCVSIAQELNLPDKLREYWQGVLGSKDKCTNYFQRYLLAEIPHPIVLGLDEVDQVFQYPQVASEFFALLRAWHETSKNKEIWKKLRLAIVHSKEVYIPLNINQSPFNVGLPIELPEFNKLQVEDLLQRHDLHWHEVEIQQFMDMLGGHPYLVRKAIYEIARGRINLSQLLQIAPTEEGFYSDHLRRHLSNLQEDINLASAMKQVVAASSSVRIDSGLAFKLRSMGLVKFQVNNVISSCELYRQYFDEHLG